MRLAIAAVILAASSWHLAAPSRAEAQGLPYCVFHRTDSQTDCHFAYFNQCVAAAQGVGFCAPNPLFVGRVYEDEDVPPRPRRRARR